MGTCQSSAEHVYDANIVKRNILLDGIDVIVWLDPKQHPACQHQRIWIEPSTNANLLGVLCWGPINENQRIEGQSMMIEEIIEIGYGRVGPTLESKEAARTISRHEDDHCFSLLGANICFGVQCSSKSERRSILSALWHIIHRREVDLWSPDDADELITSMIDTCAKLPEPAREAGIIQIDGSVGMFNYSPPHDEVWLQQALTPDEFRADVFAISAASQTGLIGKSVPKYMSPAESTNQPTNSSINPLSRPEWKQLRDASHESAKAMAEALTGYYAKNSRGIVWQYQRMSDSVGCRLFLISVPLQRVLKTSPSSSISVEALMVPPFHEDTVTEDLNGNYSYN